MDASATFFAAASSLAASASACLICSAAFFWLRNDGMQSRGHDVDPYCVTFFD